MSDAFGAILLAGITGAALWAFKSKQESDSATVTKVSYVPQESESNSTASKISAALGLVDVVAGLFGKSGVDTAPDPSTGVSSYLPSTSTGVSGLLNLIGGIEAPQGYNQVYGGSKISTPKPLTTMTIAEVMEWQRQSIAAGSASSAAGRYQILRGTLSDLVKAGYARTSDLFNATTQDKLAIALMERRGLSDYQSGRISETTFANNLAKEWASLPVVTGSKAGRSYYDGDGLNSALTGITNVISAIRGL
jgi:muramidase (phage lysozyme)